MSIEKQLEALCRVSKKLVHVLPLQPGKSVARDVFATQQVWQFLQGDAPDPKMQMVGIRSYARLESFICGESIVFGMDPLDKKSTSLIARNDPASDGVVNIRVNDPRPAVRIFGCFAKQDVIVLLLYASREELAKKGFAGTIRRTRQEWDNLIPEHSRLFSDNPNDYISGIFDIG